MFWWLVTLQPLFRSDIIIQEIAEFFLKKRVSSKQKQVHTKKGN